MTRRTSARGERLTHERIVTTAAGLIDRDGAESLSARRLGAELGVEAMSLYHHVGSMPALLDEVVGQALSGLPLPEPDARTAHRQLRVMALAFLDLARKRPRIFRVIGARRWRTPAEGAFQVRMIELLKLTGLTSREALRASRILLVYLNGAGLAIAGWVLDAETPPVETASPTVQRLIRASSATSLTNDLVQGLDSLLLSHAPKKKSP